MGLAVMFGPSRNSDVAAWIDEAGGRDKEVRSSAAAWLTCCAVASRCYTRPRSGETRVAIVETKRGSGATGKVREWKTRAALPAASTLHAIGRGPTVAGGVVAIIGGMHATAASRA